MNILHLGYTDSALIEFLERDGHTVIATDEAIDAEWVRAGTFDFLLSYGFRYILRPDVLDQFEPGRAINLHISYLPWNRGADPNFWSFLEGTPKGVTIHCLDEGVDTGDIIAQRRVALDEQRHTLASSYDALHRAIRSLFVEIWPDLVSGQLTFTPQSREAGSSHRRKDAAPHQHVLREAGWQTPVQQLTRYGVEHGLVRTEQ